jgi:hypothetical protein
VSAETLERPHPASSPAWHLVHQAWSPDAPCCDADASHQRRSKTYPEVDPAAHPFTG